MTAKGGVAGNAEMRRERLLGVSRLDGRRNDEGGQGRRRRTRKGGRKRGAANLKVRGEAASAATTAAAG